MIRKTIVTILTLLIYCVTLYFLFYAHNVLYAIPAGVVLFMMMHFFALETTHWKRYMYTIVFASWWLLLIVFFQMFDLMKVVSVVVFHLALIILIRSVHDHVVYHTKVSVRDIVQGWSYLFSLLMTVAYSMVVVYSYVTFPLTCEGLYAAVDTVTDKVTQPFSVSAQKIEQRKDNIMWTKDMTVQEAIGVESGVVASLEENDEKKLSAKGILWTLEKRKQTAVDKVVESNEKINRKICEVIVDRIKQWFENPIFQFSIVFVMFLLLGPLVRILLYLVEIVLFLLIKILLLTRVYRIYKVPVEVERIR